MAALRLLLHLANAIHRSQSSLSKNGADANTQDRYSGTTLIYASERGHIEIAQLLLEKGAEVNSQGTSYGTALIAASGRGFIEIAQLLLEKGADVNFQDQHDHSNALIAASRMGHTDVVALLIERGANVSTQDKSSGTARVMGRPRSYYERGGGGGIFDA